MGFPLCMHRCWHTPTNPAPKSLNCAFAPALEKRQIPCGRMIRPRRTKAGLRDQQRNLARELVVQRIQLGRYKILTVLRCGGEGDPAHIRVHARFTGDVVCKTLFPVVSLARGEQDVAFAVGEPGAGVAAQHAGEVAVLDSEDAVGRLGAGEDGAVGGETVGAQVRVEGGLPREPGGPRRTGLTKRVGIRREQRTRVGRVEQLADLVAKLHEGYDMVVATRMIKGAHNEEDELVFKWRKWANNAFNIMANLTWNRGRPYVTDTINGFRAITKTAWEKLALDGPGYTIEYQSSIRYLRLMIWR